MTRKERKERVQRVIFPTHDCILVILAYVREVEGY